MSTAVLSPGALPPRLDALGWSHPLHVRGVAPGGEPAIAIVGARAATREGMERAGHVARHLASRGVHVISGGALGIDGAAHRGALAAGGRTTVVLGCGVDVAYPARHASLFAEVVARGGALVSLLPDDMPPRPATFPQRNPLIAALADAVIVIEADVRSGSLSTAAAAKRLGRIVAAWPGSRGCDRLLARGAALVENVRDAEGLVHGTVRFAPPVELDPIARQVRDAIANGAVGVDAIIASTGLSLRAVLRVLPTLERCS